MANHISFHPIYIIRSGYTDAASRLHSDDQQGPCDEPTAAHPPHWGRQGWAGAVPGLPSSLRHGATCRVTEQFGSEGAVKGVSLLLFPLSSGLSVHLAKFGIAYLNPCKR